MQQEDLAAEEGAIVCSHVFDHTRPALLAIRTEGDGVLQLLCGQWDHDDIDGARIVGIGHLLEADPALAPAVGLEPGQLAERADKSSPWEVESFEEEEEEDDEEDFRD
jgi:hypothetical protein